MEQRLPVLLLYLIAAAAVLACGVVLYGVLDILDMLGVAECSVAALDIHDCAQIGIEP